MAGYGNRAIITHLPYLLLSFEEEEFLAGPLKLPSLLSLPSVLPSINLELQHVFNMYLRKQCP